MLRVAAAFCFVLALSAMPVTAQDVVLATVQGPAAPPMLLNAGPSNATFESVRTCPRVQCEVTIERGTVDGTRIRVGETGKVIPLYLSGANAYRFLSVVPAAAVEASAGRRVLRKRLGVTFIAVGAATAVLATARYRGFQSSKVSPRLGVVAGIAGGGIYMANRLQARSEPHFEEAVRLYNSALPR